MKLDAFRRRYPATTLKVNGLTWGLIESRPKGAVPVQLMLPGTLGTAEIFWNQIAALAGRAQLVSVTYPIITDVTRLADELAALCDRLGIERASAVGSSLGGYLAQMFAARHPARVDQLVIGNSLSDPTRINPSKLPLAAIKTLPGTVHRSVILKSVRSWPEPEPVFTELKELLIESGTRQLSAKALKARVLAVQTGPAVPRLEIPDSRIAVVDCADDPLIPPEIRDDVVRRYPGAEHLRLPVGGHYPYITRPDDYTRLLMRRLGLG